MSKTRLTLSDMVSAAADGCAFCNYVWTAFKEDFDFSRSSVLGREVEYKDISLQYHASFKDPSNVSVYFSAYWHPRLMKTASKTFRVSANPGNLSSSPGTPVPSC